MVEYDRLTFPPILEVEFRAVFGSEGAHSIPLLAPVIDLGTLYSIYSLVQKGLAGFPWCFLYLGI
jgi:hypothetical protein